ncbi:sensor histidine kinase [Chitinophaga nivalis]|uniref:Histidine kinase n=1 Tax=Chitinophaga nivalis TaxID=2991709 RepID=A0ABT3INJ3_9BACT|nr:histidine kinase [Chitinophaga nivalis]MCW3464752.1 histidine kinase [Chitinophaga nivalis]MCW3485557.1 histidine kinase [Chitinophaga nivalis]
MKKKTTGIRYKFWIHLMVWVLYGSECTYVYTVTAGHPEIVLIENVQIFLICAVLFYSNSDFLLPAFFERKKYFSYIGLLLLSFVLNNVVHYLVLTVANPHWLGPNANYAYYTPYELGVGATWWWFQSILLSFGYWFARLSIKRKEEVQIIRTEMTKKEMAQLKLAQEKLELENEVLRTQINPHFLFNTLGYFYNKVEDTHPEVAEGIVALTHIMRSSLRKVDTDGFVSLAEEVDNIDYLISIYKMRYSNGVYINFEKTVRCHHLRIVPHTLITLLENAFKHGDMHDAAHPLTVRLEADTSHISFFIHNKKRFGPKEISNGIGLAYVAKHLEQVYPDRHLLHIDNKEFFYTLTLNITGEAAMTQQEI